MPIYEYECAECGHRLEAIQKVAEAPLADCPSCGKAGLRRLISAAGFQLKGSGWYVTDFKNSGKKKDVAKDANTDVKEGAKSDAKADKAAASSGSGSGSDSPTPAKKTQGSQGSGH